MLRLKKLNMLIALGHLIPDEAMNCVNKCTSESCFSEVYYEPLEDGEIDQDRARLFVACLRKVILIILDCQF